MQSHIAHLISQGRSGNQPDMVTAEKILALPEIAKAMQMYNAHQKAMEGIRNKAGQRLGHSISTSPPKA